MKLGKHTYKVQNCYIKASSSVVGPLEKEGPLGSLFKYYYSDNYINEKSWEKGEQRLLKDCITNLLSDNDIVHSDIDLAISGDLLNQNSTSNYTYRYFEFPFMGIYGACSTSMQGIILGSTYIDNYGNKNIIVSTSSHNSSAEKQYRSPTEYGGPKPSSATFTVTGAASFLLTDDVTDIRIESYTIGQILDVGLKNPLDMGSAMAPAAYDTIIKHLEETGRELDYYDRIFTGDLSNIGKKVLHSIFKDNGTVITNHEDCGTLIFDTNNQPVFAGGSGCACCAVVTSEYIFSKLKDKTYKRVLVVATGALHNPTMILQHETMPCIANAVSFEYVGDE